MLPTIYLLATAIIAFVAYELYWKRRNLPPGPMPYPLLGNPIYPHVDWRIEMMKYHQKYGDVFTIWLMRDVLICISDYELIKEIFIKSGDNYVDRPRTIMTEFQAG